MERLLEFLVVAEEAIRQGGLDKLPGFMFHSLDPQKPELTVFGELDNAFWRVVLTPYLGEINILVEDFGGLLSISRQIAL